MDLKDFKKKIDDLQKSKKWERASDSIFSILNEYGSATAAYSVNEVSLKLTIIMVAERIMKEHNLTNDQDLRKPVFKAEMLAKLIELRTDGLEAAVNDFINLEGKVVIKDQKNG